MSKKENLSEKSPKLTVPEVIKYCKNDLGITFDLMDEEKAKEFLETIPSYMLDRKPSRVVKSSTMINQKFCENDSCHTTIDAYYFIERLELDI